MNGEMDNLRVVLVAVRNSLNIGAVARAMSNFGAMQLRVVNPYEAAWREAKSAVGAAELLARAEECATVAEAVADCSLVVGTTAVGNRELRQPLWSLPEAGPAIRERLKTSNVALLFGSEKWGLSNESLSYCHWLLRIPTREEHRSMNLGQAVAVCLYELGGALAPKALSTARRKAGGKKQALRAASHGSRKKDDAEAPSRPRSTRRTSSSCRRHYPSWSRRSGKPKGRKRW